MTSPLQKYLQDRDTTPGAFTLAAGVSRALVQAVAAGDMPLRGRLRNYRKKLEVEARIGMSIEDYVMQAGQRGLRQNAIALELGVQPLTLGRWLEDAEIEQVVSYRRRRKVAA